MERCGIPHKDLKVFVQQAVQENGQLDPGVIGDRGYSFGLGQWYVYPTPARLHLAKYPEKKTLDWQINELAKSACDRYALYDGDLFPAVVHHNRPVSAKAGKDRCMDKKTLALVSSCPKGSTWCSCYFRDEVGDRASLLLLSPVSSHL